MSFFNIMPAIAARGLDANADSVSGALLYVYDTGTTTPATTYTDNTGNTANAHPVVADSSGAWGGIYVRAGEYRVDVQTPLGASLPGYPMDDILISASQTILDTKAEFEAAEIEPDTDNVQLLGYATAGDGGGALYFRVASEPSHAGKIQSADGAWWEISPDKGRLSVRAFGATGDATDEYTEINNALQAANTIAASGAYSLSGSGGTESPRLDVVLDARAGSVNRFRVGTQLVVDDPHINVVGSAGVNLGVSGDASEAFSASILKFTGQVFDTEVRGLDFEITSVGGFEIDADNVSSSRNRVIDCRFTTDRFKSHTGTAIIHDNRSSQLNVESTYFNRCKKAIHSVQGDFVRTENCVFGFPKFSSFADRDGYICVEAGQYIDFGSNFNGGPAWYTGKVDEDGVAIAQYNEVCYFKMGADTPPTIDHASLTLVGTRIGYESGDGSLVYWAVAHKGNTGADTRTGITFKDIHYSSGEGKIANAEDGTEITPMILAATMPHMVKIDGVSSTNGNIGIIAAASTTTLDTLLAEAATFDYTSDIVDTMDPNSANAYSAENILATSQFIALPGGTTAANKKTARAWDRLFGKASNIFKSDNPLSTDSANTIYIPSDFAGFAETRGAIFEVFLGGKADLTSGNVIDVSVHGLIQCGYDANTDRTYATFTHSGNFADLPRGIQVTGFWNVETTPVQFVSQADAATATLGLRIQHEDNPGAELIKCRGAVIRPWRAPNAYQENGGFVQV